MNNKCIDCFYLKSKWLYNFREFLYDDYRNKYECKLHDLVSEEIRYPKEQGCEDFLSVKSAIRIEKLKKLGIWVKW